MPDSDLKKILKRAQKNHYAIGQFNFSTFEQLEAIVKATNKFKSPIILGTSEGESEFLGLKQAVALLRVYRDKTGVPFFLNLDHGKSFDYIKKAIDSGYDAVHFDGSNLPLKENIEISKRVVKYAKKFNVLVEGEVGRIGTESSKIYKQIFEINEEDLTKPEEAEEFVRKTGVDSLAVGIGTFHGIESFGKNPKIRISRLKEIKSQTKDCFLVLHGGSGTLKSDIKKAIKFGIVKININTELRVAYTKGLREVLKQNPEEITPYKYFPKVIKSVQKIVEEKLKLFGTNNKT
ncbi:MAG: class II fructose-bisphosphate aldolase [Patescibacteria group bacterium]|nr:class II fructose-bisphosphate aldolase [Patescibacteria group bacterium]